MWKVGSPLRTSQAKIPQLPVPQLSNTIPLLLQSLEPLATSKEEFVEVQKLLENFAESPETLALQEKLEAKAADCQHQVKLYLSKETNTPEEVRATLHPDGSPFPQVHFLEETWENMAYLAWQDSLSCFSNVFTTMFDATPLESDPLLRASWIVMGILDFGHQILTGSLLPDSNLCSAQYLRILFTTRLPGLERDRIVSRPVPLIVDKDELSSSGGPFADREELSRAHICVLSKNQIYSLDVTNISCEQVYVALKWIRAQSSSSRREFNLADMTGLKRDEWCRARIRLMSSSTTSAFGLRMVEEAVFHLVLSDLTPQNGTQVMQALQEAQGAWLDKSTTILCFANGCMGANLEHAAADAVVPSRMLVHANEFAIVNCAEIQGLSKFVSNSAKTTISRLKFNQSLNGKDIVPTPQRNQAKLVHFDVDTPTVEDCEAGKQYLRTVIYVENQHFTAHCRHVGTKKIKQSGMAPDSFMQMALQLAFALDAQVAQVPATYETASTRAFLHGRTECIRSQSLQSLLFVQSYFANKTNVASLKPLLLNAAKSHRHYLTMANNAKGADRHMLLLRLLGSQHPVYTNALYVRGTSFELSTSQLPWTVLDYPGFGSPFPQAYGVCYRFTESEIVCGVSCRSTPEYSKKNAQRFARHIEFAVEELIRILTPPPAAKL